MKEKIKTIVIIVMGVLLVGAVGFLICEAFDDQSWYVSFIQKKEDLYNMECGIIYACASFREGNFEQITYDFDAPEYQELIEKYNVVQIAGQGTEFEKALNLMDYFSSRLSHNGNFTEYRKDMSAADLLGYALDNPKHGIHCRAKAQIMNEEYLALGIYSRKLWINPLSVYDHECHVVNEIWDESYQKWIMLDTTNNIYWVGEEKIPLSAIEVRDKLAAQEFLTPVAPGEKLDNLEKLRERHEDILLYTAKNMAYLQYLLCYGVGEDQVVYALLPEALEPADDCLISKGAVLAKPRDIMSDTMSEERKWQERMESVH